MHAKILIVACLISTAYSLTIKKLPPGSAGVCESGQCAKGPCAACTGGQYNVNGFEGSCGWNTIASVCTPQYACAAGQSYTTSDAVGAIGCISCSDAAPGQNLIPLLNKGGQRVGKCVSCADAGGLVCDINTKTNSGLIKKCDSKHLLIYSVHSPVGANLGYCVPK